MARLKVKYTEEIAPALMKKFQYKSVMQIPQIAKVIVNVGCGESKNNAKEIEAICKDIATITGQKPITTKARKSVANFKVREGETVGVKVTLRGDTMWEFLYRLFNVALTRAKVSATISYAEMRFKWGNMEFSRPSCFLREIDPRYIESDADFAETRPQRRPGDDGPAAIDELRRRFDYRFQQKQQGGGRFGGGGNGGSGGYGSRSGSGGGFGRAADGESGPARRFARAAESRRPAAAPDPALVQTPRPSTDGMRRVGVRQAMDGGLSSGSAAAVSGEYAVGQRVEHPKFGVGIVQRIETLSTDHKLVVAFDNAGEKTLLAKFAKLTKL